MVEVKRIIRGGKNILKKEMKVGGQSKKIFRKSRWDGIKQSMPCRRRWCHCSFKSRTITAIIPVVVPLCIALFGII
jgi:hypothetical protein